jgi:hypothetical protein
VAVVVEQAVVKGFRTAGRGSAFQPKDRDDQRTQQPLSDEREAGATAGRFEHRDALMQLRADRLLEVYFHAILEHLSPVLVAVRHSCRPYTSIMPLSENSSNDEDERRVHVVPDTSGRTCSGRIWCENLSPGGSVNELGQARTAVYRRLCDMWANRG